MEILIRNSPLYLYCSNIFGETVWFIRVRQEKLEYGKDIGKIFPTFVPQFLSNATFFHQQNIPNCKFCIITKNKHFLMEKIFYCVKVFESDSLIIVGQKNVLILLY